MRQDGSLRLRHGDFRSYLWKLPRAFVDAIFFVGAIPQDSSKPRESHFTAHQPPSLAITRDNQSAVSLVR